MNKKYTRKQILESIKYWTKVLKESDEVFYPDEFDDDIRYDIDVERKTLKLAANEAAQWIKTQLNDNVGECIWDYDESDDGNVMNMVCKEHGMIVKIIGGGDVLEDLKYDDDCSYQFINTLSKSIFDNDGAYSVYKSNNYRYTYLKPGKYDAKIKYKQFNSTIQFMITVNKRQEFFSDEFFSDDHA